MASNSDGSIVIEVDLTAKEAEQGLSRLKKKILRLNESLYVGEHKKSSLVAQLKEAEQELDNLQKKTTILRRGITRGFAWRGHHFWRILYRKWPCV